MRCSFRFFSSCSSSSFMPVRLRSPEQKILPRHAPQNHPFHTVQIVESILRGFGHGGQKWLERVLLPQPEQLPHGKSGNSTALLLQRCQISRDRRYSLDQDLFGRMWIASFDALSARGLVLGQGNAYLVRRRHTDVPDDVPYVELNLNPVSALTHFHAAPDPGDRNRVADHMQRDISFHIHRSLMQPVDFGNPCRQRLQMHSLCRKQLPRHGADMLFVSPVDPVAPLSGLLVQIVQSENLRPARKLFSINQNGRSTRAERFASPRSCATKRKPKRSAKASISATGVISLPVPRSTTTCVLSIITRPGTPPIYFRASVRKTLQSKR